MNVEAVREQQRRAFLQVRLDVFVELRLRRVRREDRDEADAFDGFGGRLDGEAVALRLRRRVAVGSHADDDVVAGIAQIHRMRAALAAVAEHRNFLAAERARIDIRFVYRASSHFSKT